MNHCYHSCQYIKAFWKSLSRVDVLKSVAFEKKIMTKLILFRLYWLSLIPFEVPNRRIVSDHKQSTLDDFRIVSD